MSKKKKLIILFIMILILLILIISLLIYIRRYLNSRGSDTGDDLSQNISTYVPTTTIEAVNNLNKYYAVKIIATKYYTNLATLNKKEEDMLNQVRIKADNFSISDYSNEQKSEAKKELLSMIDEEYINANGLNENNIQEKFGTYNENGNLYINHIYMSEESECITTYFVYGYIKYINTNEIEEFNLMVQLDSKNNTYSILPYDYMVSKGYDKLKLGEEFKTNISEIKNRTYNKFSYINIKEEDYVIDLLDSYKNNLLCSVEKAYDTLDEDYRNKRFGNIEEFKKHIIKNKDDIMFINLAGYSVKEKNGYKEYICLDKRGNYYIFKQTAILEYKLLLDTYTIDIDSIISAYDQGNNEKKTLLNSRKFIEAINLKDYSYAYNLLDTNFKNNYFQTQDIFENYIKQVLYEKNEIKSYEYNENQNVGVIKLTINNKLDENQSKEFAIVMKLKEDRNFTMSFQIQ